MTQPLRLRSEQPNPAAHFERAAFAAAMAAANKQGVEFAVRAFPDDRVLPILLKAAVDPGSTSGWAAELAQESTGAFFESVAPKSAAAALMKRGVLVDVVGGQLSLPRRATAIQRLPWVGEGDPIPVSSETMALSTLTLKKMGVIFVCTREVVKRASGQEVFTILLREAAALSLDAAVFSASAGSDTVHAGLLYGVTATAPTGDFKEDLSALAGEAGTGGSGEIMFITGPGRAAAIGVHLPELKASVLPSLAVPEARVIAVDPLSFAFGTGTEPEFLASGGATLHMNDNPAQIGENGSIASPARSMWQTDTIAFSCVAELAFARRRPGAVAFMDDIYGW